MYFSLSSIASVTAIAAAAAVKRQQEVGSIEIQDAVASNMTMNLVTSDDTSIPIGLNNGVLTTGQDPITVNFLPVNSQYMEYDNDNDDNEKFGGWYVFVNLIISDIF